MGNSTNGAKSAPHVTKGTIASLLEMIKHPVGAGPDFVKNSPAAPRNIAIALHALIMGFYVLSLYHSLNQKLLRSFVDLANSLSKGLANTSEEVLNVLKGSVVFFLSKIPLLGETISGAADQYLTDNLYLLTSYLTTETNNFLNELYPAVSLPEGIGFVAGVVTTLVGIGLSALVLKLFLHIAKHPTHSFSEIFSLLAIRSVVCIPIVFVLAIVSLFLPTLGILLFPLAMIFGMSYMCAVLFHSSDKTSEDRLVYVFPFLLILLLLVSLLVFALQGAATGASIGTRLSAFSQTLQQTMQ